MTRGRLVPVGLGLLAVLALVVAGVLGLGSQRRSANCKDHPSPSIASRLVSCTIDTNDGTINDLVEITNRDSEPLSAQASLLFHHEGIRVGDGTSYTTLRPGESARLAIIGESSQWPGWYGEADSYDAHTKLAFQTRLLRQSITIPFVERLW